MCRFTRAVLAMNSKILLLVLVSLAVGVLAVDPVVELNTGGLLAGKEITYNGQQVQLFLGVPYAEAPVGENRFAKPKPFPAWNGQRPAVTLGNPCPQSAGFGGAVIGNEDCLFLDITVPGAIDPSAKKPVMVWIHGGNYISGSKDRFLGAALAVAGDVIVITINYRLAVLGFFAGGNFGLWDQRQALIWVQDNIEKFGGDPDLVTVFGQSAGAGCVSAQMNGQYNDGLFTRAIQQSGSVYNGRGWFLSDRQQHDFVQKVRSDFDCVPTETVYECLKAVSVDELFTQVQGPVPMRNYFLPAPDGDFFAADVAEDDYELSKRFDMLAGFNGQDGLLGIAFLGPALSNGLSVDEVRRFLQTSVCPNTTPLSVQLCVDYLLDAYQLDLAPNNTQRVIELSYMLGELNFHIDVVQQLSVHSNGSKSTYGFYFTELVNRTRLYTVPEQLRQSADHGDEVVYVFGSSYLDAEDIWTDYYGEGWEQIPYLKLNSDFLRASNAVKSFSDLLMTAWTNFARTGNPNQPTPLPSGAPEWPEFNRNTTKFMELNSVNPQVITTPNKERVKDVYDAIYPARRQQVLADVAPGGSCEPVDEQEPESEDNMDDGNSATMREISLMAGLLVLFFHLY